MLIPIKSSAVALALLLGLTAQTAQAHALLVKADPRVGSTVNGAPPRLWLKFTEVPRLNASGVQLTWPDGQARLLQPLAQDQADVRAVLAPLPRLGPGRYHVLWRVLSPDGHRTQGTFSFDVKAP
jgi:methionine-rich copper-binding protein CopC